MGLLVVSQGSAIRSGRSAAAAGARLQQERRLQQWQLQHSCDSRDSWVTAVAAASEAVVPGAGGCGRGLHPCIGGSCAQGRQPGGWGTLHCQGPMQWHINKQRNMAVAWGSQCFDPFWAGMGRQRVGCRGEGRDSGGSAASVACAWRADPHTDAGACIPLEPLAKHTAQDGILYLHSCVMQSVSKHQQQ